MKQIKQFFLEGESPTLVFFLLLLLSKLSFRILEPGTTSTYLPTTMRKPELDTSVICAAVVGSILFSVILLSVIIYFGLRKVRADLDGFNQLLLSREENEVTMDQGSTSDSKCFRSFRKNILTVILAEH